MEAILQKCCQADNEAIQQGTQELKDALKKPDAIAALCEVVVGAQDAQNRQYAAVVLGRRMSKRKNWKKLDVKDHALIKNGILEAYLKEPHKPVRNSLAYFIGVIVKHDFPNPGWPLLEKMVLEELPYSNDAARRELGMYLLSTIVDMNPKLFVNSAVKVCELVANSLKTYSNEQSIAPEVDYAIDILKSLALGLQNVQVVVNTAYEAVPVIIKSVYFSSRGNEERAVKLIQLLDDLSESVPLVFDPHLKIVVEMCLELGKTESLEDQVRIKALAFLGLLVTKKKKALLKSNLVQSILDTIFLIVATAPAESEDFDEDDDTPSTVANQTLDSVALNLPPGKVVPPMLRHIEAGMESEEPFPRKAACLSMAVMAEGCAEYIRTKHLKHFIQYVLRGIQDDCAIVRNAALFALGQFSEHLQPDISNYSEQVMPVLFSYLDNLCQVLREHGEPQKHPEHITRIFYALEMFCENLSERLTPYLLAVVERLLSILNSPASVKVRELAISALNSAASAAKEEMAPFVPKILESLHTFLTQPQEDEMLSLQIYSVDTLAVLARSLGKENFRPLANESLKIALTLVTKVDDPDLRRTTYGLFGALSAVLEGEMAHVLEHVLTMMLGALKSEEGNAVLDIKDKESDLAVYDDLSDEDDEVDISAESDRSEDADDLQIHVEDAFTEEKEEACTAIGEIAKNTGAAFLPFFPKCFEQIALMVNHPGIQVRASALEALAEMTAALGAEGMDKKEEQQKALMMIVPKCAEIIQTDYERDVVGAALDALDTLLVKIKAPVLEAEGHREAIVNSIVQVLEWKTQCQEDDEPTGEDEEAEQDELLFEYAGNIIPNLGKAMPHDDFLILFKNVLPILLSKAKEGSSTAQKSFVVGTLAETMEVLGDDAASYFEQLLPIFLNFMNDEEDEVRNNAVFALGELVLHSKNTAVPAYPTILMQLSNAISKETTPGSLDNICGALARMIIVHPSGVPLATVLPVLIDKLPLREDFEENLSIFKCLNGLYEMGDLTLKQLIPRIILIAITVIYKKQHTKNETLESVVGLLTRIKLDFPNEFQEAANSLSTEQLQVLQERLA